MLVSFTLGNYRSFNEPVMLTMRKFPRLSGEDRLDETHLIKTRRADLDLLKSAAIYGANAGGKSNLLRGLIEMREFVLYSQRDFRPRRTLSCDKFAFSEKTLKESTIFEIMFLLEDDLYRYGFEIDKRKIESEWLFKNDEKLFDRSLADGIKVFSEFKEGNGLAKRTGATALFLSVCSSFNGSIAGKVVSFFMKIKWINSSRSTFRLVSPSLQRDESLLKRVAEILKNAGTGIEKMIPAVKEKKYFSLNGEEEIRKINTLEVEHQCQMPNKLDIDEESDGTKKLLQLASPLITAMERGDILIIDEFDTQLHPLLLEMTLQMFHSKENQKSQMIFSIHNTFPLRQKMLRRDQVWFTEKQQDLSSRLVNLAEYKIRPDASYEKDYLKGRYGGIPALEIPEIFDGFNSDEQE